MKKLNKIKKVSFLLVIITFLFCSREEKLSSESVIKTVDETKLSKFDKFLKKEFIDSYNIEVSYKLNDIDTDLNYNVTPVSEEKAIKMANLIKYICLDAYAAHSDKNFLKKYFPKKIVLIGSGAYNDNSTVVLGTAQGGVKIVLYDINNIDPTDSDKLVEKYFNTIFHEFSHILHQNKTYTKDFEKISSTDYVGDSWNNYWGNSSTGTSPSYTKGFISNYSSKEKNEDFVEIISHHITLSDAQWNDKIDPNNDNTTGVEMMNKKLNIVKNYMNQSWSINIDDMKTEVQNRLSNLSNVDLDKID